MAKKIPLSKNKFAIVDDDDFQILSVLRWHVHKKEKDRYHYAVSSTGKKMHRVIMGAGPNDIVDHINLDGLDNRRSNLRVCTKSENCRNQAVRKDNTSGFKGVHLRCGKWRVQIRYEGKYQNIGTFSDKIEAARAYDAAAKKHHGPYARLNFP